MSDDLRRQADEIRWCHSIEFAHDPTTWWGPNPEPVVGMLHAVGFPHVEVVSPDSRAYRIARSARRLRDDVSERARHGGRSVTHPAHGRVVVHAFRERS